MQKILLSGKSARKKVKTFSHTRTSRGMEGGTEQGQPATTQKKEKPEQNHKGREREGEHTKSRQNEGRKRGEGGGRKHTGSQPWQAEEQQHKAEPATEQNHSKGKGQTQS